MNVNRLGRLCRSCHDIWWETEVLPDLRRAQAEFEDLREYNRIGGLRQCDESLVSLSRSERRRIIDVQLPDGPADEHLTKTRSGTDLRPAPSSSGPLQDTGREALG